MALQYPWCMGFLATTQPRFEAWRPLRNLNRVEHESLPPILLHCVGSPGRPMLGPPREVAETETFLRSAWRDIPPVIHESRESWMPERVWQPTVNPDRGVPVSDTAYELELVDAEPAESARVARREFS